MPDPTRRRLRFDQIEAIMPEVDRLLAGHVAAGRWTLGMICDHLARSIDLTLRTPPGDDPPTREQAVLRRLFFRRPETFEGQPIPWLEQHPDPAADAGSAADALRDAVGRLGRHAGPWPSHPVLGPMPRDEWLLFHARHAAHHLGFVAPAP